MTLTLELVLTVLVLSTTAGIGWVFGTRIANALLGIAHKT